MLYSKSPKNTGRLHICSCERSIIYNVIMNVFFCKKSTGYFQELEEMSGKFYLTVEYHIISIFTGQKKYMFISERGDCGENHFD